MNGIVRCVARRAGNSASRGWNTAHSSRRNIQAGSHGNTDDTRQGKRTKRRSTRGGKGAEGKKTDNTSTRNERMRGNRGACTNGELLFAGLLFWPVGPSFVRPAHSLRLLVPSVTIASSSSSSSWFSPSFPSPKHACPALASALLFL